METDILLWIYFVCESYLVELSKKVNWCSHLWNNNIKPRGLNGFWKLGNSCNWGASSLFVFLVWQQTFYLQSWSISHVYFKRMLCLLRVCCVSAACLRGCWTVTEWEFSSPIVELWLFTHLQALQWHMQVIQSKYQACRVPDPLACRGESWWCLWSLAQSHLIRWVSSAVSYSGNKLNSISLLIINVIESLWELWCLSLHLVYSEGNEVLT